VLSETTSKIDTGVYYSDVRFPISYANSGFVVVGVAGNGTGSTNSMDAPAISSVSKTNFLVATHSINNTGAPTSPNTRLRYISIGI
jgi:hypothetical protein